jgi:hypothetical protein
VIPAVVGSSPIVHPNFESSASTAGRSSSSHPIKPPAPAGSQRQDLRPGIGLQEGPSTHQRTSLLVVETEHALLRGQSLERGGEPRKSSFPTSLVVFRSNQPEPWTPQLYWFPRHLRPRDLDYFDYLIVNGTPDVHASLASWHVVPLTTSGRWRLYRVTR